MTYAKNVVSINKAIAKALLGAAKQGIDEKLTEWENMVAKGAGLAYDVKNGNIEPEYEAPTPSDGQDYQDNYEVEVL